MKKLTENNINGVCRLYSTFSSLKTEGKSTYDV